MEHNRDHSRSGCLDVLDVGSGNVAGSVVEFGVVQLVEDTVKRLRDYTHDWTVVYCRVVWRVLQEFVSVFVYHSGK